MIKRLLRKRPFALLFFSIVGPLLIVFLFFFYKSAWDVRLERELQYENAWAEVQNENYQDAIDILKGLGDYQGVKKDISYLEALLLFNDEKFDEAIEKFTELGEYRDSKEYLSNTEEAKAKKASYNEACSFYAEESYAQAYKIFYELGDYKESLRLAEESVTRWRIKLANTGNTISAGVIQSGGLTESGTVEFVARYFDERQKIKNWRDVVSVAAGSYFFAALKKDGTVEIAKYLHNYAYPIDVSKWTDIVSISMGDQFIVGLKRDGTVVAAGIDGYGETNVSSWKDIVDIDTGWQHTVGLDKYGNVYVAGKNAKELQEEIACKANEWSNLTAIAIGGSTGSGTHGDGHIVGLKQDGSVVAVGDNEFNQCNVTGSEWHDIIAISAGAYHTIALRNDGKVLTTQDKSDFAESYNEITAWKNIVAVSAGYGFTLALTENGNVKSAGNHDDGQREGVNLWENIEKNATVS